MLWELSVAEQRTIASSAHTRQRCIPKLGDWTLGVSRMPMTHEQQQVPEPTTPARPARTAKDEWRKGIRQLIISAVVLAVMLALWWLVATTNREGHHDAQLLPLLTLIPLLPALYHLFHARFHSSKHG
jgi:hypothetical protein